MWIAPNDDERMIVGHDNGAIITTDGGKTSTRVAVPTGQFYHVYLTNHFPYDVCGAKQDAGSSCGPVREESRGRSFGGGRGRGRRRGVPVSTFYGIAGGESGYVAGDPLDPDITYGGNYSGVLEKMDHATGMSVRLDPWPLNPMGHSAEDSKYRFQWTYPIMNSPHNPHVLYVGSNVLFKSSDDGATWKIISPDLTRHDPATLVGALGGPITKDQTSIEYYGTIFAVQELADHAGSHLDGVGRRLIYLTRDGGQHWSNVTPKGLPKWTRISIIDPSPHAPGTAWVAANRYQLDDYAPYLYKTTDYGHTWTKIVNGLPGASTPGRSAKILVRPNMLYASTRVAWDVVVVRRRRALAEACSATCRRFPCTTSHSVMTTS